MPAMPWDHLAEVCVAALLGAAIGLDRELRGRPAGLRTNMLVAMSAAMFVILAETLVDSVAVPTLVRSDPIRIIEAIVTGVAFLGAGTIFRSRGSDAIEGLTTAASLLMSAALGVAAAADRWLLAGGSVIIALIVLSGIGALESAVSNRRARRSADGADPPQS